MQSYKALISRLSIEEVTFSAASENEAWTKLSELVKRTEGGIAVNYALAESDDRYQVHHNFEPLNLLRLEASRLPRSGAADVLRFMHDELAKCWIVTDALSNGMTTEDLAFDQESSVEEVLASRDYLDEYDAFMQFIVFARRALNLPDLLEEDVAE